MVKQDSTVLFVSHDASRTGAPIFLLRFLRWFRKHPQVPFRILVGSSGDLLQDFVSAGATDVFEPQPNTLRRVLRRLKVAAPEASNHRNMLRKNLAQSNVGLVYSNTMMNGKILDFLSFLKCPVICHVHELEQVVRQSSDAANIRLVRRHTSSYVAVSHAVKHNLMANHGIPEEEIQVVHGFVPVGDTDLQQPSIGVHEELAIPREARLVLSCGSIEPRKGSDLFLKVAGIVARRALAAPVHFVWVGGRPDAVRAMRKEVKSVSLGKFVHFIGHRTNLERYYEAADIFLLPSREDPFPLVMLEAALRSNPVVCFSESGGALEFVEQDAGFAIPNFDVGEMATKVQLLLASEDMRNQMGAAGRQKVLKLHNINSAAPRLAGIIEQALCGKVWREAGEVEPPNVCGESHLVME